MIYGFMEIITKLKPTFGPIHRVTVVFVASCSSYDVNRGQWICVVVRHHFVVINRVQSFIGMLMSFKYNINSSNIEYALQANKKKGKREF